MATKKKGFRWADTTRYERGNQKYDWDAWFDGDTWKLTFMEDFDVDPEIMRQMIYDRAGARGYKVKTHIDDDHNVYLRKVGVKKKRSYSDLLEETRRKKEEANSGG